MAAPMERPAAGLTSSDGGRTTVGDKDEHTERAESGAVIRPRREDSGLSVAAVPATRRLANRAYVQALIDARGLTVGGVDAYADWLVNQYHQERPRDREVLRVAIVAYMDGYDHGYDAGLEAGVEEGRSLARRDLQP